MSIESLCTRTAVVTYETQTQSDLGFATVAATRYSSMPCRIHALKAAERMMYKSEKVEATHKLWAPIDYSGLAFQDIVTEGGRVYNVVHAWSEDDGEGEHHVKAILREIQKAL